MAMSSYGLHGVRWLALSLVLVMAQMLSGMLAHALLGSTVSASFLNTPVDWQGILTIAGAEAAAVYCLLTGLRVGRRHQVWLLFAFYWGTKYMQMLIEAAFFLNVWQAEPVMSWPELVFSAFYGTLTVVLFAPVAVWIAAVRPVEARLPVLLPPLLPALTIGSVYVPIYFGAGFLIAVPLAGAAFADTYENLQLPTWLPLLQFARGMLWAGIVWLVIGNHGGHRDSRITAGVALGIVSSFQLLLPNPYMAEQLRAAHLAEVVISMTAFGWLSGWIFSLRWARRRNRGAREPVQ
jgi:hypothetical protein